MNTRRALLVAAGLLFIGVLESLAGEGVQRAGFE